MVTSPSLTSTPKLTHSTMYTLLSGLYKSLTQKDEFFVLILGLDNAGKTTFLEAAKTQFGENRTRNKKRTATTRMTKMTKTFILRRWRR